MALTVWRTGAWRMQIVKRSNAAEFAVLPKRFGGSLKEHSHGSTAIAAWHATSNAMRQRSSPSFAMLKRSSQTVRRRDHGAARTHQDRPPLGPIHVTTGGTNPPGIAHRVTIFFVAVIAALANFMDAALQSVEGGVAPSPVNQLIVRTILGQAPMVERQDAVGVANRRQAVGDNEN